MLVAVAGEINRQTKKRAPALSTVACLLQPHTQAFIHEGLTENTHPYAALIETVFSAGQTGQARRNKGCSTRDVYF